jgi:hypothetical protein
VVDYAGGGIDYAFLLIATNAVTKETNVRNWNVAR